MGTGDEVQAQLAQLLPGLAWQRGPETSWSGFSGSRADASVAVHLVQQAGSVHFLSVAAGPPVLRRLMSGLRLTHCCASESGELRDPFAAGDRWPQP